MLKLLQLLTVPILICGSVSIPVTPKDSSNPAFSYQDARAHELQPHRRSFPLDGVPLGHHSLRLLVTVSPAGDVVDVQPDLVEDLLKFWPQVQDEVRRWKFAPFLQNGKAVTGDIEEYVSFVPPTRLPKTHVIPPALRPDSEIAITLQRSGCFGSCPSYSVTMRNHGIVFEGRGYTVVTGKHTASVDPDEVRRLAQRFIEADFYSMEPNYAAMVTDCPTYTLSISVDGVTKEVIDYMGDWVGMPPVITDLENAVDSLARTDRWIAGGDGLVEALRAEKFDFQSYAAQLMAKQAASRGRIDAVREFLDAGVPLAPIPRPAGDNPNERGPLISSGWLTAAGAQPATLLFLIERGASKADQQDKDEALLVAARMGHAASVEALIGYGAKPQADRK